MFLVDEKPVKESKGKTATPNRSLKEHCMLLWLHRGRRSGSAVEQLVETRCGDQRPVCRQEAADTAA